MAFIQQIQAVITKYQAELAAMPQIVGLEDDTEVSSACERLYVEEILQQLQSLPSGEGVTEEAFKQKFNTLMASLQAKYANAHSILASPDNIGNKCCLEIFNIVYPQASNIEFLATFFPMVKQHVYFDTADALLSPVARRSSDNLVLTIQAQSLEDASIVVNKVKRSTFVISGDCIFLASDAITNKLNILYQRCQLFRENYPYLYSQLKSHNSNIKRLYENVELLQEKTLNQMIEELKLVLNQNGATVTGNRMELSQNCQLNVERASQAFRDYLNSFTREDEEFKQAKSELLNVYSNGCRCIEVAQDRLVCFQQLKDNMNLLSSSPSLKGEDRSEKEVDIQQIKNKLFLVRKGVTQLPAEFLKKLIGKISITGVTTLVQFLKKFNSLDIYEVTLRLHYQVIADVQNFKVLLQSFVADIQKINIACQAVKVNIPKFIQTKTDFSILVTSVSGVVGLDSVLTEMCQSYNQDFLSIYNSLYAAQRSVFKSSNRWQDYTNTNVNSRFCETKGGLDLFLDVQTQVSKEPDSRTAIALSLLNRRYNGELTDSQLDIEIKVEGFKHSNALASVDVHGVSFWSAGSYRQALEMEVSQSSTLKLR